MIINNVKLVLENEVVHGSLEMQDGGNPRLCRKPESPVRSNGRRRRLAATGAD